LIKVESATKGDAIRHRGGTDAEASKEGMSTSYLTQGAGKRSLALALENHVPQTMQRLGLDEESLAAKHPHLIHCAMTGYGRGGPQENTAAYDVNIQAACGLMDATGTQQSGPTRTGAPILDYATALAASFAISAALIERTSTGAGNFIDVSMLETGLSLMSSSVTDYLKTGNVPKRRGNLANSRSPGAGSFSCKEGVLSLGVNEESHFISLSKALGREDWLSDSRYAQRAVRHKHASELANEIELELAKRTAKEWEPVLQSAGVPSARLRSMPEALDSAQVQARGFVQTTVDGVQVPTLPFRLGGAEAYCPISKAPARGEHSEEILEWLRTENN